MALRRETKLLLAFISPWMIGFTMFLIGPMVASLYLAFTRYSIQSYPRWVGLQNFRAVFLGWEPNFYHSLQVTLVYVILAVPMGLIVALSAALLLNLQSIKGKSIFRTLFFLPSLLPVAASGIVWAWVFNPKNGLLNRVIELVSGQQGPEWLSNPRLALYCLVVIATWGFGGGMIIFLAGLQGVPRHLMEAALIDGANMWQRFRHVTIPQISPVIFFNLIMGMIGAMQVFSVAYIFQQADASVSREATHFYVLNIFYHAFLYDRFGLACALAWVLFVMILILTSVQFWAGRKWVHYES